MKCYLENAGALSSDNKIAMEQAMVHFSASEDIIKSCLEEQSEIGMSINLHQKIEQK